jgi:lipopolysaccharide transport system permease protein
MIMTRLRSPRKPPELAFTRSMSLLLGMLRDLWSYRNFVFSSIRNELVSRFVRSKLGGVWMIIQPLAQVAIFALILSNVLAARLPGIESKYGYASYLLAGILAWSLMEEILNRCLNLFIGQANLIKKMHFPRITLPVIAIGSSLVNNLLLLAALLFIFLLLGNNFGWVMLWIVPLTLAVVLVSAGVGLILGILNVFLRDVGQVIPIVLQLSFWLTPIVYPVSIIPEQYRHLMNLNPFYHMIEGYHQVLVYGQMPDLLALFWLYLSGALLVVLGMFMFWRANEEMVDVL